MSHMRLALHAAPIVPAMALIIQVRAAQVCLGTYALFDT